MPRHLVLALVLLLMLPAAVLAEPLRVATEGAYPPFNYVKDDGSLGGFDVDIARALCAAMEAECTFRAVAWDEILDGLESGDYDLVVASMAKTPERDARVDFTRRYYRSRSAFVGDPRRIPGTDPASLMGLTVATQKGTVQAAYLEEHYAPKVEVKLTEGLDQAYALLASGQADAVLTDSLNIYEFLKTPQGEGFDFVGDPLPADDPSSASHIAVRQGDDQLRERLDKALETIKLDGTYDRINRAYFPFSIY